MTYDPTDWHDGEEGGTPMTAANLKAAETGIATYAEGLVAGERSDRQDAVAALTTTVAGIMGLQEPTNGTHATASLATGAREVSTIPLAEAYRLRRIVTDKAARVRLYIDAAHRDADAARPSTVDPPDYPTANANPAHGCMFEAITDATHLDLPVSVEGWATADAVPIIVDNLGATGVVNVTIYFQRIEP